MQELISSTNHQWRHNPIECKLQTQPRITQQEHTWDCGREKVSEETKVEYECSGKNINMELGYKVKDKVTVNPVASMTVQNVPDHITSSITVT